MTYRIGWLSPMTPASGVGTFSHAVTEQMPSELDGEVIDLTVLYLDHCKLYTSRHRSIQIENTNNFHHVLSLFDLLIYNIGNNHEHHEAIFNMLKVQPGIIVCHDYVYQHYIAERSVRSGQGFASYATLLMKYGGPAAWDQITRSRITSRTGQIRYSPWDSEISVQQPMSEAILSLGSALVVHSTFAEDHARKSFEGPIAKLGMPWDQKSAIAADGQDAWARMVTMKRRFHMVSFGYIQSTKCIDLVLAALAASKGLRRKLRYTVAGFVGDGAYFEELQRMVAASALRDVVSFEIAVSEARLGELMRDADLFVNLRKPNTEGSSASLIEQLNVGRPVVVLDSGCFAEIPSGAAVKLPADASSLDIQLALEKLVANPDQLPAIGGGGRDYARTWSCAFYAERLVRFARDNRVLLGERGKALGIRGDAQAKHDRDDPWLRNLAQARSSLHYLDRNVFTIDPSLVSTLSGEALCTYVAHVLLGIFNNPNLVRALRRYFAGRDRRTTYWSCVRFGLIAQAAFGDAAASRRVALMGPCYEPEFWRVIESFPAAPFYTAAALVLGQRPPTKSDLDAFGADDRDGYPRRLRLAEIIGALKPDDAAGEVKELMRWLSEPLEPECDHEHPVVDHDVECVVGSTAFRAVADLSGFYRQERDHAWTRGCRGFIGLRLGAVVTRVEIVIRHIDARKDLPCTVTLSAGPAQASVLLRNQDPTPLALDLTVREAVPAALTWLQLSASRAAPPAGSGDTRMLGVCLMNLSVTTAPLEPVRRSALQMAEVG